MRARVTVGHVQAGGDVEARAVAAVLGFERGRYRHGDLAVGVGCPAQLLVRGGWLVVDVQLRRARDASERVEGAGTVLPESAWVRVRGAAQGAPGLGAKVGARIGVQFNPSACRWPQ